MAGFFRSQKISLCTMLLHTESAFDCLVEVGNIGLVQFLNATANENVSNLIFTNQVTRLIDLQQTMRRVQKELDECGIETVFYPDVDTEEVPKQTDLRDIENVLEDLDKELFTVNKNFDVLNNKRVMLHEQLHVLSHCSAFLTGGNNTEAVMAWSDSIIMGLLRDNMKKQRVDPSLRIGFLAGSVPMRRFHAFERMLWRMCHHNFYLKHSESTIDVEDPRDPSKSEGKYAFMVFFVGDVMRQHVSKVCQGFECVLHECPESRTERAELNLKIKVELEDLKIVLEKTDQQRRQILYIIAADLYIWRVKAKKMLAVYVVLNKMRFVHESNRRYLQAECWIPQKSVGVVRHALVRGTIRAAKGGGSMFQPMITKKHNYFFMPPTYFKLNRFTQGFQNLIDAYGTATYRELNPAPYTIITFPFLFAIMFGDCGHGLILMLFASFLILKADMIERSQKNAKSPNEIVDILFSGRYIILLMGVFSIYTGFIYNDVFSKSFNLFGSSWKVNFTESEVKSEKEWDLNPATRSNFYGKPYWFGIDPIWTAATESAITTFNSIKMKTAIVLGVMQMVFGLMLSAWNAVYFNDNIDLYLVFLPQIVFLLALFGYLSFLIFFKWGLYGGICPGGPLCAGCAPSILITFINMMLMRGEPASGEGCKGFMFDFQGEVQMILLIVALLCVPILLVGKPLALWQQDRRRNVSNHDFNLKGPDSAMRKSLSIYSTEQLKVKNKYSEHAAEIWIHQSIHCVESILGTISHTASYLRLWALSLAHAQLSHVLWNMVLRHGFTRKGYIGAIIIYFSFAFWAGLTIAILVVMEALSAFLHTLRLHWVEFQSKFFEGAGSPFTPFKFERSTRQD